MTKTLHICIILVFLLFHHPVSPIPYNDTETSLVNESFCNNNETMPRNEVKTIITLKTGQNESEIIKYLSQIDATEVVYHWLIHAISVKVDAKYVVDIMKRPEVKKVWRDEKVHAHEEIGMC